LGVRNPGDYPTEATSGTGQRHHQVVEVGEVIDRAMSGGTLRPGPRVVKKSCYPAIRFIASSMASTSEGATGG